MTEPKTDTPSNNDKAAAPGGLAAGARPSPDPQRAGDGGETGAGKAASETAGRSPSKAGGKPLAEAERQDLAGGAGGKPAAETVGAAPSPAPGEAGSKAGSPARASKGGPSASGPGGPGPVQSSGRGRGLLIAFVIAVLIAAGLAAGLWYQQKTFKQSHQELRDQAQGNASAISQAGSQVQQALAAVREQTQRIDALQAGLSAAQGQVADLEQAFQVLTDKGSDLVLLNDIDHLVQITHQQLVLSGNVGNAIVALETAQARLARANRPNLASLQQAINGDLDRLRAVSTVDVSRLSARLEELGALLGRAPLLVPDRAAPTMETPHSGAGAQPEAAASSLAADAPWWRRGLDTAGQWAGQAWTMVRNDLGGLVSVRRVDDSSALLLSPEQADLLRENLRLRVMAAQLALMMRQPDIWNSEMRVLEKALDTYYDGTAHTTQRARKLVSQLAGTTVEATLPDVENSLQALLALREADAAQASGQPEAQGADGPVSAAPGPDAPGDRSSALQE